MELTLDCLAAILCVLGLTGLLWWLFGRMLGSCPEQDGCMILFGRGDGDGLEQSVRSCLWLRSMGAVCPQILIADGGLNRQGREIALKLCARWPNVVLWPLGDLNHYIEFTMRGGDGSGQFYDAE